MTTQTEIIRIAAVFLNTLPPSTQPVVKDICWGVRNFLDTAVNKKMYFGLHVKYPFCLSDFNET
jgi:hypothetical protein